MNTLLLLAALIYIVRLAGFVLSAERTLSWEAFLRFAPISVFAALVVLGVSNGTGPLPARFIALVAAGVTMWRTQRIGLSVLIGLAALWILAAAGV